MKVLNQLQQYYHFSNYIFKCMPSIFLISLIVFRYTWNKRADKISVIFLLSEFHEFFLFDSFYELRGGILHRNLFCSFRIRGGEHDITEAVSVSIKLVSNLHLFLLVLVIQEVLERIPFFEEQFFLCSAIKDTSTLLGNRSWDRILLCAEDFHFFR